MRKIFFSGLFIIVILMGCSNDEAYNNSLQKGLDYIASEEFQKAEGAFESALDEKKDDVKATVLLNQTKSYQNAMVALEEGELELAVEEAEKVTKEENGSNALVKKAEDILLSIEGLEVTLDELTKEYSLAIEHFEAKDYAQATEIIDVLLAKDLAHPVYQSIKQDIEELQGNIEVVVIANEKAAKEQAEKENAAKIEAEKAAASKAKQAEETKKVEATVNTFNGDMAIQLAEKEYGGGDTGYSYDTEVNYENGVAYYNVRLYSKSMQAEGGSGTLFFVNVFEDGTIVEAY